ncbi:hypothetical protein F0L68_38665 [Solihabitans fulvus]|uniref:Pyridoxamine 5'-phosphate oxidase N-terminal domain-containing protein n=1 Tax=Solihabitans fulvus TaxID=1892852 RepID=A0A5B2WJV2_9PSEU|nr:pyridoxamine 5'-phosphate oxidase family protein [Solihabitans fulvus]KAA2250736.1 hypothetical protein F0L68_38665 [Solihabitans fulvus]
MGLSEATGRAIEILRANRYTALATQDAGGPWVAVVGHIAMAPDKLYFVSRHVSRHGTAVRAEPRVAGVIYDSTVELDKADGIQFAGLCRETEANDALLRRFLDRAADQLADSVEEELAAFHANDEFRLYEITVTTAYVLDQQAWAEEGIDSREDVDVATLFAAVESDFAA